MTREEKCDSMMEAMLITHKANNERRWQSKVQHEKIRAFRGMFMNAVFIRFCYLQDGDFIAALQVHVRKNGKGTALCIYTRKEYRRKGISKLLLQEAALHFQLEISKNRTPLGAQLADHLKTLNLHNIII
jgi:GNAT superfamily N-acetyltransferase